MQHESKLAARPCRRNHGQRKTPAGNCNHRRLALRRPGSSGVIVRANVRLVGNEDRGPCGVRLRANSGIGFVSHWCSITGSCCQAWYSGFCTVKPNQRMMRLTEASASFCPNSLWTNLASSESVHKPNSILSCMGVSSCSGFASQRI